MVQEELVRTWLEEVKDPEIPVLSLIDLGVITKIEVQNGKEVTVRMTPTFVGCPAMDHMVNEVKEVLMRNGISSPMVEVSFDKAWTSDNITEKGRKALKEFGLAPPPMHNMVIELDILEHVPCPYCSSTNTEMKSPFGPTLCRSLHYCLDCRQAFEQFKPL